MVPTSTPSENLYIETGIRDMTHNITHRRTNIHTKREPIYRNRNKRHDT